MKVEDVEVGIKVSVHPLGEEPYEVQGELGTRIRPEFGLFKSEFGHLQYGIVTCQADVDNFLAEHPHRTDHIFKMQAPHNGAVTIHDGDISLIHMDIADGLTRGKDKTLGLLVHECYHVCERIFLLMGEERPSSEFFAYTIQAVFQSLTAELRERGFDI
jgi:hypothetical protein